MSSWIDNAYGSNKAKSQDVPPSRPITQGNKLSLQNRVLEVLKIEPGHRSLSTEEIYAKSNIDITTRDDVIILLKGNPKVKMTEDGKYAFKDVYDIRNRTDILNCLKDESKGIRLKLIVDNYMEIEDDVRQYAYNTEIIVDRNGEKNDATLFDRGATYRVPLSGTVSIRKHSSMLVTSHDLRSEITRGDAIYIQDMVFRVSYKGGVNSRLGPCKWEFVSGASSTTPAETRDGQPFQDSFDSERLPLDRMWKGGDINNIKVYKEGCSDDIRLLWNSTSERDDFPIDRKALDNIMLRQGLLSREQVNKRKAQERSINERKRKAKLKLNSQNKIRKKRKRLNTTDTNAHMENTEIGNRAAAMEINSGSFHTG